VAGSEKPVIVRFVTEGGPSVGKVINKWCWGIIIKYVTDEMKSCKISAEPYYAGKLKFLSESFIKTCDILHELSLLSQK
jgi:hypothetical protein